MMAQIILDHVGRGPVEIVSRQPAHPDENVVDQNDVNFAVSLKDKDEKLLMRSKVHFQLHCQVCLDDEGYFLHFLCESRSGL